MIDSAEPLSLVIWAVFAFAAGLYPLGVMLGAPCNPCCGSTCDDVFEFNRCVRYVNVDTSSPRTSYSAGETVDTPMHGYSRAVSRPEDVGAKQVATRLVLTSVLNIADGASAMSDGETRTASYSVRYTAGAADLGEAVNWAVTLRGVTMPLSPPVAVEPTYVDIVSNSTTIAAQYSAGSTTFSTSSPVSVSVHSCDAGAVSQWLDGSAVTENTLRSMLSVSVSMNGDAQYGNWAVTALFTPNVSAFRFLPRFTYFPLKYVIKHTRGTKHRYSTLQVLVRQVNVPEALPAGGFPAFLNNPPPYIDSPFTRTPPEFGGDLATAQTAVVYSDNANLDDDFSAIGVQLPGVQIDPTGAQLNHTEYAVQATNAQYLSFQSPASNVISRGWIMRPRDPSFLNDFQFNDWIYDTERIADWLNGEETVPYNSGQFISPTDSSWTMQVSEPSAFCGYSLCTSSVFMQNMSWVGATYGGVVESTVVVQTAAEPATTSSSDEKGPITRTNRCYGQEAPPVISMRLSPNSCSYTGEHTSCINSTSAVGYNQGGGYYINRQGQGDGVPLTRQRGAPARYFYCGDLLWAIENGPCRTSLTIPYLNWGNETYTLGGSSSSNWVNNSRCVFSGVDQNGACHPLEATVTLDEDMLLGRRPSGDNAGILAGKIVAGNYVMTLSAGGAVLFDTNCNQQVYCLSFPVVPINVPQHTSSYMCLVRRRELWCSSWDTSGYWLGNINVFYGLFRAPFPVVGGATAVSLGGAGGSFAHVGLIVFPGSVEFGGQSSPYSTTVTPQSTTIGKDGGNVSLTYCCPERTQNITVPQHSSKFPRTIVLETNGQAGRGATAYITQAGYGGVECPFNVIWLAGSIFVPDFPLPNNTEGRIFSSPTCPIVAQIVPAEQPECDWSVQSSAAWIIATKSETGLLEITIDSNVTPVFLPSTNPYWLPRPYRFGTITINTQGLSKTWSIVQMQP